MLSRSIGNQRYLDFPLSEILPEKGNIVNLRSTFRGYVFEESLKLNLTAAITEIAPETVTVSYSDSKIRLEIPSLPVQFRAEIYMMNGVCISKNDLPIGISNEEISTEGWSRGIHLVKLTFGNKVITRKVAVY